MKTSQAIIVIDLAYGDCGKGTMIDYFARQTGAHSVVRFNGGPQAGHNVVTPQGQHHTFSQFASGTFTGARTLLSRFMLIEPYALINEAKHLLSMGISNAWERLFIDERCLVITPLHQAFNRLRERFRGSAAHGTCGLGVGEAMEDHLLHPELSLFAGDLADRNVVAKKLAALAELKRFQLKALLADTTCRASVESEIATIFRSDWFEAAIHNYAEVAAAASILNSAQFTQQLRGPGVVLFEGAQGVLLDEEFGFHPHTTWSKTTSAPAIQLLTETGSDAAIRKVGVLRTYFTRHGQGPFVTEEATLRPALSEPHNDDFGWQSYFRVGMFDAPAVRYALRATGGVDEIALTHVDRLAALPAHICTAYRLPPSLPDGFFQVIAGRATDIHFVPNPTLDRQAALTRLLNECTPVTTACQPNSVDSFVRLLEAQLFKIPITILSAGPTSNDKITRTISTENVTARTESYL